MKGLKKQEENLILNLKKMSKSYWQRVGWMFLLPSVVAYDKQKHWVFGAFWSTISFFLLVGEAGISDLVAGIISIVFAFIIGGIIEIFHYYNPDRHSDYKDMLWTGYGSVVVILYILIRIINGLYN